MESQALLSRKSSRLACDRCFSLKEKCDFQTGGRPPACSRCTRLARTCVTSRKQRTTGRPRKHISTSSRPQAGAEFVWNREQAQSQDTTPSLKNEGSPSPHERLPSLLLAAPSDSLLAGKTSYELLLLDGAFNKRDFMCRFVLGKSFVASAADRLYVGLRLFPEDMSNVFLALSARFARKMRRSILEEQASRLDYTHSAKAVRALRERGSASGLGESDLRPILMLGLGVLTLDLLDSGLYSHTIVRFTIDVVQHFYSREAQASNAIATQTAIPQGLDADLIPLVFMDTCNCIVRREVPVYRLRPQHPETVDRYIGLCGSLLPHLYDICCISSDIRRNSAAGTGDFESKLGAVENSVLQWEPPADEYLGMLAAQEMDAIRVQAKVYRLATMLIIHRLRFPFGREDETATQLSQDILSDVENLYHSWSAASQISDGKTGSRQTPDGGCPFEYRLGFPFLVASIEVEDLLEWQCLLEVVDTIVRVGMYPNVSGLMRQFMVYIWDARDVGICTYWFDQVAYGPPLVLF